MSRKEHNRNIGLHCFYGTTERTLQLLDEIRMKSDQAMEEDNKPTDPKRAALVEEVLDLAFGKERYDWRRPTDTENVLIIACLRMEHRISCKNCNRRGKCNPQQTTDCVSKHRRYFRPTGELFKDAFRKVRVLTDAYERLKADDNPQTANELDKMP